MDFSFTHTKDLCDNNRVLLLSSTLEFVRYVYMLSKWCPDANEQAYNFGPRRLF